MSVGRVVMLELNELCPPLLDRFMKQGKLPNFSRLYREAQIFTTDAEEDPPNLEPWIQWVTVHTGLPYAEHNVFHLGDANKLQGETIADIAGKNDRRVWLCGSMNLPVRPPIHGAVLPDMWNTSTPPIPDELGPFARFINVQVQEHTNERMPLGVSDYIKAATFIATHGMSMSSIQSVAKQLADEARRPADRWKRALILDRLATDLFQHYYRKLNPHFATLFLNTVAHYQHKYWRNMEPEHFEQKPSAADQEKFKDAILCAHQSFDQVIGNVLDAVGDDTTVILCTALSQQPYVRAEASGGKRFYRPHRFEDLSTMLGLNDVEKFLPVMSEQFHILFAGNEPAAQEAERKLSALRLGDVPLMEVERRGAEIFAGCKVHDLIDDGARIHDEKGTDVGFYDLFYRADSIKSGSHHRDGCLWIRQPSRQHEVHDGHVPLRAVAPTIVDLLGLPRPEAMKLSPLVAA